MYWQAKEGGMNSYEGHGLVYIQDCEEREG